MVLLLLAAARQGQLGG